MATTAPATEVGTRVRKSAADLSRDEAGRLVLAFRALQDSGAYASHAVMAGPTQSKHADPLFLPWNRALCATFETTLTERGADALPFWDFTASGLREEAVPPLFRSAPLDSGPLPTGNPTDVTQRAIGRPGAGALPTPEEVAGLLDTEDFRLFASGLEQLHNQVHVWVGGDMGTVPTAPYDPLYWPLQAGVDRIWWLWQQRHSDASLRGELLERPLEPFGWSVHDVLDTDELGYTYGGAPTSYEAATEYESGAVNDRPPDLDADSLGFGAYAAAFAEVIASPSTTPPLTIGIFGSWGTGKSTLLDAIEKKIRDDQPKDPPKKRSAADRADESPFVHIVRFNAWDYNSTELIWPALARETMKRIRDDLPGGPVARFLAVFARNVLRQWRRNAARIVVGVIFLAVAAAFALVKLDAKGTTVVAALGVIGLGGLLKVVNDTVNSPASKWVSSLFKGENYGQRVSYMEDIKDDLEWLEQRLLPKDEEEAKADRRVLVVIDDLDRCEPEKAVEVLQAVNRLLDLKTFIVCLGFDARIVTAAVQSHYENVLKDSGVSGFEYLDKIVQIPFRIPEPSDPAIKRFLEGQLPTHAIDDTAGPPVLAKPAIGPVPPGGPLGDALQYPTQQAGEQSFERPLGQRVAWREEEAQAFRDISSYLRPNPRHVKRLINVYRLVRSLAECRRRAGGDQEQEAHVVMDNPVETIRWLTISAQWPYTANAMLVEGRRREQDAAAEKSPTLKTLHDAVRAAHPRANRFDDELARLKDLVDATPMSWAQLSVIRNYTINFNPAVEHQLRLEQMNEGKPAD